MNKRVVLLYIALAGGLLPGQTWSHRDATAPVTTPPAKRPPGSAKSFRSNCVYRRLDGNSLSVKPCSTDSPKLRLVPPLEKIAPATQPGKTG
jgi:hypothetical protein